MGKDLALIGRRGFTTCVDVYLVPHVKYVIQKLFRSSRHFADILQKVLLPILIFAVFNGTLRRLLGVRKYVFYIYVLNGHYITALQAAKHLSHQQISGLLSGYDCEIRMGLLV